MSVNDPFFLKPFINLAKLHQAAHIAKSTGVPEFQSAKFSQSIGLNLSLNKIYGNLQSLHTEIQTNFGSSIHQFDLNFLKPIAPETREFHIGKHFIQEMGKSYIKDKAVLSDIGQQVSNYVRTDDNNILIKLNEQIQGMEANTNKVPVSHSQF